jgi:general secretion pathway protein A
MYLQRFGLQREPFSIAPDPRALFLSERHREALAHLLYGAQAGGGFVLLTGAIGAGKTTVCRALLERLPANCRIAYVFHPQLNSHELLQTVCDEFGVAYGSPPPRSAKGFIDPLNRFLLERHAAGDHCLLIVDEAQRLSSAVLEQLRLLTNLETSSHKLLQIMLIGQPELREMLAKPEMEQLAQRVIARYHLEGLAQDETLAYVEHRLRRAGLQGDLPFSTAGLRALHRLSGGIPRRINLLADRALLGLYASGQRIAGRRVLRQAARELGGETGRSKSLPAWPVRAGLAALGLLALLAAAGLWLQRPIPLAAPASEAKPLQAATAPASSPVPAAPLPPTGYTQPQQALPALARLWGEPAWPAGPCSQQAGALRCWSARLSLPALRALDRPGVVSLLDTQGRPQTLLLLALDEQTVRLQGQQGEARELRLLDFLQRWNGDYLTLWQAPAGWPDRLALRGNGPLARWLDRQLDDAGAPQLSDRVQRVTAFQRAEGLKADGEAGPLTLMRLAQRSRPDEPRLKRP